MILNNQTYLGKMVQHKDIKISYKDKKKRRLPKEQWIVVDNTHEPIIDQETFDRVQAIQKIKRKEDENMEYEYNDKRRFVKYKTAAKRYDVCLPTLEKWAKEAGAICKIGRAVLVDCQALDKYIEAFRLPPE